MNFTYHIPTKIVIGPGSLQELKSLPLPGSRALIVITSGGSMKRLGYLDRLTSILADRGIESVLYEKVLPNPIVRNVAEGAELAKQSSCDFIIGLGGGSSIDTAKSIALLANNPGNYWDYIIGGTGKGIPVENGALPIVAVTTTAGTGTEADPFTVITNDETKEKIGFASIPHTFPVLAIVDPELMTSVPPRLTAFQGFDAFFHAAEGYISQAANPISDSFALKSIALIAKYLPKAVQNGKDIEARSQVALANTLSGMVLSTSRLTSQHSLAHALSAFHPEIAHGEALILVSQAYFSFFYEKNPKKFEEMAQVMYGGKGKGKRSFLEEFDQLIRSCGVEDLSMSAHGILAEDLPSLIVNARETMGRLFAMDSYTLSYEDTLEIMKRAYR